MFIHRGSREKRALFVFSFMQTILRSGLAEITKGLSTGFVVWAGSGCPDCAPVLHCSECICNGAERIVHPQGSPINIFFAVVLLSIGLLVGFVFGKLYFTRSITVTNTIAAVPHERKEKKGTWGLRITDGSSSSTGSTGKR